MMVNKTFIIKLNKWQITIILIIIAFVAVNWIYKPYYFEDNPAKLLNIGIEYLSKNDYPNATKAFEKANNKVTSSYGEYYLGYCLFQSDDRKDSFNHIKKAIELDPKNDKAYLLLGDYYLFMDNSGEALKYYNKALQLKPNSMAYFKLGKFYYQKGNIEKAYEYLTTSHDKDPNNLEVYPYLAEMYNKKGLFVSAFESYEFYMHEKCNQGIPYTFLLSKEAESIEKKMRSLRDMAGEI